MPLSKVKSTKQAKRKEARILAYNQLPSDLKEENGGGFRKPGSNKK